MNRLAAWCVGLALIALPASATAKPRPPEQPPFPPDDEYRPPPAQEVLPVPEPESPYRHTTWFIGFGLGGRTMSYEDESGDAHAGPVFVAHLGGMFNERIGMLVWFATDEHSFDFDEQKAALTSIGPAVVYRATPRLWLRGGLGTGEWILREFGDEVASYKARTFTGSVGYEAWSRKNMTLDVELRIFSTTVDPGGLDAHRGGLGVLAAFTWY